jgi:NAD(P)-dependent dehydrogenase (short-subunit alcohol dehydrogenase family)
MKKETAMEERPVALITGGAQGIGKAMVGEFSRAGYRLALLDVDQDAGRETAAELAAGGDVLLLTADVGREEQVAAALADLERRFGRLDVLVNNAGFCLRKPLLDLSLAEWQRVLDVCLTGAFLCSRQALPLLRRSRGAIVNIASTRALMSEPDTESYAAAKGGLVALTHALAVSLGPEIRVNCISPGWIDVTGWQQRSRRQPAVIAPEEHAQHPVGRVGRPEDVAALALFLAGQRSGFMTGQNLVLDGGMTRKMIYLE